MTVVNMPMESCINDPQTYANPVFGKTYNNNHCKRICSTYKIHWEKECFAINSDLQDHLTMPIYLSIYMLSPASKTYSRLGHVCFALTRTETSRTNKAISHIGCTQYLCHYSCIFQYNVRMLKLNSYITGLHITISESCIFLQYWYNNTMYLLIFITPWFYG